MKHLLIPGRDITTGPQLRLDSTEDITLKTRVYVWYPGLITGYYRIKKLEVIECSKRIQLDLYDFRKPIGYPVRWSQEPDYIWVPESLSDHDDPFLAPSFSDAELRRIIRSLHAQRCNLPVHVDTDGVPHGGDDHELYLGILSKLQRNCALRGMPNFMGKFQW